MADWMNREFVLQTAQPFDEFRAPWITAPQGPCWAIDNPQFHEIYLQWAARMGKTNISMAFLAKTAAEEPQEMMFASADEGTIKSVFSRYWKILEQITCLEGEVPSRRMQAATKIKLRSSVIHAAFSGSKPSMADKSIKRAAGNELDKWVQDSTSTEGDPAARFLKRGAEYPDRKFIMESTPSVRGQSRVEEGRHKSTNHAFQVPCPHCGKYQVIRGPHHAYEKGRGGFVWKKREDGKPDIKLAKTTVHYRCQCCDGEIGEEHRNTMNWHGVWVPAGCEVDHEKAFNARELPPDDTSWLIGEPRINENRYGSQISVFYATFHTFGDIIQSFLEKRDKPQVYRQWINEDAGETWSPKRSNLTVEAIAAKCAGNFEPGMVPEDVAFLTIGIDVQESHFVFVVMGWGLQDRAYVIEYGYEISWPALVKDVLSRSYRCLDGSTLPLKRGGIDSSFNTSEIYKLCLQIPGGSLRPIKGSDAMQKPVEKSTLEHSKDKKRRAQLLSAGQFLWKVNRSFFQEAMQGRLDNAAAGEPGSFNFPAPAVHDAEFLEQVLNQCQQATKSGRMVWGKVDDDKPDDYRDAIMIAMAMAHTVTGGFPERLRHIWEARKQALLPKKAQPEAAPQPGWIDRHKRS